MKDKNKKLIMILVLAFILVIVGVYVFIHNQSRTNVNPNENQPSGNTPQEEYPSDTITEKDFTLYETEGVEKSTIIQYNDDNTSHIYVLITNHDDTPLELTNFTLDVFSKEKEYLASKKFETVVLDPNGGCHLFEWDSDIENVEPTQVSWRAPSN